MGNKKNMRLDEIKDIEREFDELRRLKIKRKKRLIKIPEWFLAVMFLTVFGTYETIDNLKFQGKHSLIRHIIADEWYNKGKALGKEGRLEEAIKRY
ncbi:MAG: hypothetical protein KKF89_01220, partial [Nanoarchaeota archaeon]|nr:hypothetical protein [Nanoarchaeota archaeon]